MEESPSFPSPSSPEAAVDLEESSGPVAGQTPEASSLDLFVAAANSFKLGFEAKIFAGCGDKTLSGDFTTEPLSVEAEVLSAEEAVVEVGIGATFGGFEDGIKDGVAFSFVKEAASVWLVGGLTPHPIALEAGAEDDIMPDEPASTEQSLPVEDWLVEEDAALDLTTFGEGRVVDVVDAASLKFLSPVMGVSKGLTIYREIINIWILTITTGTLVE